MKVTEQWRDRRRDLLGEFFSCAACGASSAVRRLSCSHCGDASPAVRAALPATLIAAGWSHSHLIVETLDQTGPRAPIMLMELPAGRMLPMALADSDAAHAPALVGCELHLVLRRTAAAGAKSPIRYGRKVAADPATRIRISKKPEISKQEKQ